MGCCETKCRFPYNSTSDKEFRGYDPLPTEQKYMKRFSTRDMISRRSSNFSTEYAEVKKIGSGTFGAVIDAVHKKTSIHRAVKIIDKSLLSSEETRLLFNEIEILRDLDHPNIMKIYEYYESEGKLFIVGELYTGGELLDRISRMKNFNEQKAADIMKQILSAVNYCHQHNIVHRDLKPANILFDSNEENCIVKLVDFGVSTQVEPGTMFKKSMGTPMFMAPEVIKENYNEKCDIWSCGVILYIVLSGQMPFNGASPQAITNQILYGNFCMEGPDWMYVSPEAKRFIRRLMTMDYTKRPSAAEALKDPWIIVNATENLNEDTLTETALKKLLSYPAKNKLQEAFWINLANNFSRKEERNEYLKAFQELDLDGNGSLSVDELRRGFSKFGKTEKDIEEIIRLADTNGNGVIDYSEFVAATIARENFLESDRLEAAFRAFDRNGDGYLNLEEIKAIFSEDLKITDAEWKNLIKEVDTNNDGEISYSEFKEMITNLISKQEQLSESALSTDRFQQVEKKA